MGVVGSFFCSLASLIAHASVFRKGSRDPSHAKEEYDEFAYPAFLS
jgi:hypothetical protein